MSTDDDDNRSTPLELRVEGGLWITRLCLTLFRFNSSRSFFIMEFIKTESQQKLISPNANLSVQFERE